MACSFCMGVVVYLFVCPCVCEQMSKNGAFMILQFILVIVIVEWCKLGWGHFWGIH